MNLMAVYGSVSFIAQTIAALPIDVFRRQDDGSAIEVAPPPWLVNPNDDLDIHEFEIQALTSVLLEGNSYVPYTLDAGFMVSQLAVLDPEKVQLRIENGRIVPYVDGRRYTGRLKHVRGLMLPGHVKGLSPLEAARQSIGLGLAAQDFAARFYSNGQNMSGVIEVEGDLTTDQARDLKTAFVNDNSGNTKAFLPGVLFGGATFKPISVTPEQAQFIEGRHFSSSEIAAQLFMLDPTLLGIAVEGKSLTYANLEQRGIHLVQFSLMPWIVRLERLYNSLLPRRQFAKLNVNGLMRADLKVRYESYRIGIETGFVNPNEAREKEDMPPYEGGDTFFTPGQQTNQPVGDEPPADAGAAA